MSCPQRVMPHRMVSTLDEDCRVFIWKLNVGTGHLHCGVRSQRRESHVTLSWSGPVSLVSGAVIIGQVLSA